MFILTAPQNYLNISWQLPAKTESWANEYLITQEGLASSFCEFISYPWATIIDMLRKDNSPDLQMLVNSFLKFPPRKTLIRATVCQHIYAMDMLDSFKRLKITDLYWSHAVIDHSVIDGIRIHPFPLYPVACEGESRISEKSHDISKRSFLYSFIGAYEPNLYLTPVRQWIFDLPFRSDSVVIKRNEWHFEKQVYSEQIAGKSLTRLEKTDIDQKFFEYKSVLNESIFSLCPSGSGPNSIRLWESLGFGCIPVLLSDTLRLPGDQALWDQAIIRVCEEPEAVAKIPSLLEGIAQDRGRLLTMQQAGRVLWGLYGLDNGPRTILGELSSKDAIRKLILG